MDNISREALEKGLSHFDGFETSVAEDWLIEKVRALRDALDKAETAKKARPLPRSKEHKKLGWKLDVNLLMEVRMEVQAEGWDTCLEVTELAMMAAERRILAALPYQSQEDVTYG